MSDTTSFHDADLPDPPIRPNIPGEGRFPLSEVLPGLQERDVFAGIAGPIDPDELYDGAFVLCFKGHGFPRVDDDTGAILCPASYVTGYDPMVVYLDIVHELVHTRQVFEGRRIYHFPQPYVKWPTEIEAYRVTYEEATRLGIDETWFWRYLAVPWVDEEDLRELARSIGMEPPALTPGADAEETARH